MGREAIDPFPMVPLAKGQGLGIAIMSYNGKMNFGLVGDFDVMYDIDDLARRSLRSRWTSWPRRPEWS